MAAPSWGQLLPTKVSRHDPGERDGNSASQKKALTIDTDTKRQHLSGQSFTQARQNRSSTLTDALTISTQSPFASPTASTFRAEGLAPRPASFGHAGGDSSKEFLERRRRRESRNREQYLDENPSAIAPDGPRPAPPISYKLSQSNSASSASNHAPARSRSTRESDGPVNATDTLAEHYPDARYKHGGSKRGASEDKALGSGDKWNRDGLERRSRPRKGSIPEAEAQRHREWAPDKSPLQRLELTLDSITKEEKRARVEEAELLAREAKAGRGGERANRTSVRFRDRPVTKAQNSGSQSEPQSLREAGLIRSLSNTQKGQLQRAATVESRRPPSDSAPTLEGTGRSFDYQPQPGLDRQRSENRSNQGGQGAQGQSAPEVVGTAGIGAKKWLARSGSNKLKKEPPGDPWGKLRRLAEGASKLGSGQPVAARMAPPGSKVPVSDPSIKDKELPPIPKALYTTAAPTGRSNDNDDGIDHEPRRGNAKKTEQPRGGEASIDQQVFDDSTRALGHTSSQRQPGVPQSRAGSGVDRIGTPSGNDAASLRNAAPLANGRHHLSNLFHHSGHTRLTGLGVYVPSRRLDEWRRGGAILLDGAMLDLHMTDGTDAEKDKAWWEAGNSRRRERSVTKQRKAEAYDGEYDDSNVPTRFKPALFLKCGPLLRYCGLRRERLQGRLAPDAPRPQREVWRGSVMIVTEDARSSYELAPTLRLFVQPTDLLPPPPAQVDGEIDELDPEYIDPIAGLPKVGRDGRTLYVRPVDHLEEAQDLSKDESDEGLFESRRSQLDGGKDTKKSGRNSHFDGEKVGQYREIRGFRLHVEHGVTFWKFNIEIELREKQQRIAYRINRGPATGFWVPARDQAMNIMFYSCNGFSLSVNPHEFSGPDPMWRDVLNTHQTQPFHVMLGGGDQIYNDSVVQETILFKRWTEIRDHHHKERMPFTPELQDELEKFYLNHYAMWFSQGLFGLAASQIPMINIFDDHDIIDGWGSYHDSYMKSPVMSGLGSTAFKYYMLFQHQSSIDEGEDTEPSWILGAEPGPYIPELSRSIFTHLGRSIAFLGLDCRTERMDGEVVSPKTYDRVFSRLERDIIKGETKHLIVLLGIPVAYPRMVWLENILTSRFMDPVKALGRMGLLGKGLLNHLDGGVEILDDLDDHWTARHHKDERHFLIDELQNLAAEKSVRITFLGGDVHLAAIGRFYSNPKLQIPKDRDYRYMPNIISSAIVNTPPPDTIADLLNRRDKIHHLDAHTDEDLMPIFTHDVNGKPRANRRLLNRRNWCSIRVYNPDLSPPPTPDGASFSESPGTPPKRGNILRRLSGSGGPRHHQLDRSGADTSYPPLSGSSFFNRRPSSSRRESSDSQRPGVLTRTLSLTRKDFMPGTLFRRNSRRKPDDGGINGYGADSDDDSEHHQDEPSGIRGGGAEDDDGYGHSTSTHLGRVTSQTGKQSSTPAVGYRPQSASARNKFYRTPTLQPGKKGRLGSGEINLEGGLDIRLNVEVNSKDPAGITTPYRLLVPRLWYEEELDHQEAAQNVKAGLKRWVSFTARRNAKGNVAERWSDTPSVERVEMPRGR